MRRPSTLCTSLFVLLAVTSAAAAQELPKATGDGLSTTYDVVEKPEKIDVETGRSLGRRLVRYDWAGWSASACMFDPAVAFRFYSGARSTQVQICFMCGEMALDGIGGLYGNKKGLPDADRKAWRRAAQKAFPDERFVELP
jgi:hypothetical protein